MEGQKVLRRKVLIRPEKQGLDTKSGEGQPEACRDAISENQPIRFWHVKRLGYPKTQQIG
jgi:hypothetical protein